MVDFQISLAKASSGEIMVYANYKSGNVPVLVERVIIQEIDSQGQVAFTSSHQLNRSLDPGVQGNYLLVSKPPSGSNIKAASAIAYYIEIDKVAKSRTLPL